MTLKVKDTREELEILDHNITRLKVEYEQYFMRIAKREPLFLRGQVEKKIAYFSNAYIPNTGDNFKFRNLADKYNSFKQYWMRTLKAIEAGTYTRKSEAGRTRTGLEAPSIEKISKAEIIEYIDIIEEIKPPKGEDPIKELYNSYVRALKDLNEPTGKITYDLMKRAVTAQKKKATAKYGTSDFEFKIKTVDGKVKVQIKPEK